MNNFKIINFSAKQHKLDYKINKSRGFVEWGSDNNYPNDLLDTYNFEGSTLHQSIVNRKTHMVGGNGFVDNETKDKLEMNSLDGCDDFLNRITNDFELFEGFAYEVIYNNKGEISSFQHIPFQNVRIGVKNDEIDFEYFWISDDWTQYRKAAYEPQFIPKWTPLNKKGKSLVYVKGYNPQAQFYPIQTYTNALNYINLDYEIGVFHLSQARDGYSPSFVMNFTDGIPTQEEMSEMKRAFDREYKGTSNAGKILFTYTEVGGEAPTIEKIDMNDSDERFLNLNKQIEQNILTAHQVVSPTLFGIYQEGSLGDKNNLIDSLQIYNATYIKPRQKQIMNSLNKVLGKGLVIDPFVLDIIDENDKDNDILITE